MGKCQYPTIIELPYNKRGNVSQGQIENAAVLFLVRLGGLRANWFILLLLPLSAQDRDFRFLCGGFLLTE
ncbi:TPA: hypothetical protein DDW35_07270 [Candidatus Sumerlaeota bacterium]|nr:hypothetical protein [Candidatus Sumerlaeota bacterium]